MPEENVEDLLRFDPLAVAEKVTGTNYKEDESTTALGMLLSMANGNRKENTLRNLGDTYSQIPWDDFVQVVLNSPLGFALEWQGTFKDDHHGTPGDEGVFVDQTRSLLIHAHSYGHPDWYDGAQKHVNMARLYYQIELLTKESQENFWGVQHSGGCVDKATMTWAGDIDGREGLLYWATKLQMCGGNLVPWKFPMHFWPLNYSEEHEGERLQKESGNRANYSPFDTLILNKIAQWPPALRAMGEIAVQRTA